MKVKTIVLLFFVTSAIFAQELNIKGRWKVNCALEKKDSATLHVCDICPTTILANNTAVIEEFELEFTDNIILIPHDELKLEIPYKFNRNNNLISFKYKQKQYDFKAMIISDPFVQILIAESGEVLYLKKIM